MNSPRLLKNFVSAGILLIVLGGSLFIGLMIATAGGAVYPPIVTVVAPLACSGKVEAVSHRYSYKPGQQGISREIYCLEAGSKQRKDITLISVFYAFLVYSAALFILALIFVVPLLWWLNRKTAGIVKNFSKSAGYWQETIQAKQHTKEQNHILIDLRAPGNADVNSQVFKSDTDKDNNPNIEQRLQQLKRLRESGLITEQDYESKKAEVLSQL